MTISHHINSFFSKSKSPVCRAAETSLRFGIGGRVSVCCHNHIDIVGNIKDQSISEIWNGEKIKQLRKTLSKKFAKGCTHCIAESKSVNFAKSSNLYNRYPPESEFPVILDFKADNRCNLQCVMCSGLSSHQFECHTSTEENPYYNPSFFEDLKPWLSKIKEARFSGGEPFITPLYFDIWEFLMNENPSCKIVVQTNGTILNNRIKELLEKGNFHINVSIDSFDKNTYEKIRVRSNFEQVTHHIDWFRNYCKTNQRFFGITSCALKSNKDELYKIAIKWSELEANGWYSTVWFPPSEALWTLNAEDFNAVYDNLNNSLSINSNLNQANFDSSKTLLSVLKEMKRINSLYHNPKLLISATEFKDIILKALKTELSANHIDDKIALYFSKNASSKFNGDVFQKICTFTSSEMLYDLFYCIQTSEMNKMLDYFKK